MGRGLIHKRVAPFFTRKCSQVTLSGISTPFGVLSPTYGQIIHVLLTRPPLTLNFPPPKLCSIKSPFDLHVLGTPPAFVLSQDQTLHIKVLSCSLYASFVFLYLSVYSIFPVFSTGTRSSLFLSIFQCAPPLVSEDRSILYHTTLPTSSPF
jgi:hypothetical protein